MRNGRYPNAKSAGGGLALGMKYAFSEPHETKNDKLVTSIHMYLKKVDYWPMAWDGITTLDPCNQHKIKQLATVLHSHAYNLVHNGDLHSM